MYTDLTLAILDEENPRGHPILAALLYAFCPAAARWWREGARPDLTFDVLWQALADRAEGRTLKDMLVAYGFEGLVADAQEYVEKVRVYRGHHFGTPAPETLPLFRGPELNVQKRFNKSEAIANLGRRWDNFFEYVRCWAFVYPDWVEGFHFGKTPEFQAVRLALSLPGIRRPAHFPAWLWTLPGSERAILGILAEDARDPDQLRVALVQEAARALEPVPEVWILARAGGQATPSDPKIRPGQLQPLLMGLAALAEKGPYPPLRGLTQPAGCRACGFFGQCFEKGSGKSLARRVLSPRVLEASGE